MAADFAAGTNFCARFPVSTSPAYRFPCESRAMSCTQWKAPAERAGGTGVAAAAAAARRAAGVTRRGDDGAAVAGEREDLVVAPVGEIQVPLLRIAREGDVPHRSVAGGARLDRELLHEGAVPLEPLHAIVEPVADVDEPVLGEPDAMDWITELLRRRIGRRLIAAHGDLLRVARRLSVGAPVSLVRSGFGVEDDDAAVLVPVGHEDFVGGRIELHSGGLPEPRRIGAVCLRTWFADLRHELTVAGEAEDLPVVVAVAADPHKAFAVDVDAVLVLRPVVAFARPAPRTEQPPFAVEFENRRRRRAALRRRRMERQGLLVLGERARSLQDPDVIVGVDRDPAHLAEDPVVG